MTHISRSASLGSHPLTGHNTNRSTEPNPLISALDLAGMTDRQPAQWQTLQANAALLVYDVYDTNQQLLNNCKQAIPKYLTAISANHKTVVGYHRNLEQAITWDKKDATDTWPFKPLPLPPGRDYSSALHISRTGIISGQAGIKQGQNYAVMWDKDQPPFQLPSLEDSDDIRPLGISDNGHYVGGVSIARYTPVQHRRRKTPKEPKMIKFMTAMYWDLQTLCVDSIPDPAPQPDSQNGVYGISNDGKIIICEINGQLSVYWAETKELKTLAELKNENRIIGDIESAFSWENITADGRLIASDMYGQSTISLRLTDAPSSQPDEAPPAARTDRPRTASNVAA